MKPGGKAMTKRTLGGTALAVASMLGFLAGGDAHAAIFRAYLSVQGNDANPCTLQQPCRLLPAALATVNDGGEIWMLDSANFNTTTVVVNKSVTILAIPGALGSVVANNATGMAIASPSAKVTLRNVVVLNLAGSANTGVSFTQGVGLTLEGCELYGMQNAVDMGASGAILTIKDSTIRDNLAAGIIVRAAADAVLRNVAILNNSLQGISAFGGAAVAITGSSIVGSMTGINVHASGAETTQVAITGTTVSGNTTGLSVIGSGGGAAQAMISSVTFTMNSIGAGIGAGGTVFSRQNNTFKFNAGDLAAGSTLTSLPAL
jgi:hypothetical protein